MRDPEFFTCSIAIDLGERTKFRRCSYVVVTRARKMNEICGQRG